MEGKLVSMFDEPHFDITQWMFWFLMWGGRGRRREGISSQSCRKQVQGKTLPGGLAQCVNTFPREAGRQESGWASHAGPRLVAQTHSDGCIQLQRAVEWGNRVPGRCFQQQLCVLEGSWFLGCRAKELTVRAMTMFPSSKGICNAHLPKPDWEREISSYFPKM